MTTRADDGLLARARRLGLYGLLARWDEVQGQDWLPGLLGAEEHERRRRGFERRLRRAWLTRFKPMADFDWDWPKKIDREQVEELFACASSTRPPTWSSVAPTGSGRS